MFVSNTTHDQAWQKESDANAATGSAQAGAAAGAGPSQNNIDLESGKGIAGWVLRIEGRLLDVSPDERVVPPLPTLAT